MGLNNLNYAISKKGITSVAAGNLTYQIVDNELIIEQAGTLIGKILFPKGDKGDKGDPGEKGDKGDQGIQGEQGIQGIAGIGVKNVYINEDDHLIVVLDDDTEKDAGVVPKALAPVITENASNDSTTYKLDITDEDGNVLTTPNLKGEGGGVSDYEQLSKIPTLNGVDLKGSLVGSDVFLQDLITEWKANKSYTIGNLVIKDNLIYVAIVNSSDATFIEVHWQALGSKESNPDDDIDFDELLSEEVTTISFDGETMIINGKYEYDGETLTLYGASLDGETLIL